MGKMGQLPDLDKIIELPVPEEILTHIKTKKNGKIEERCLQRASKKILLK